MTPPQGEYPPQQPQNPIWANQPPPAGGQQPTQPGQFPAAPGAGYGPPQKKSNGRRVALIVLAVIVGLCGFSAVLSAVNGGDDKNTDKPSSTAAAVPGTNAPGAPAAPPAENTPEAQPGLNTPVRDGKFEFVVTDVQTGLSEVGDNPYLQRKAQGAYTIVSLTVKNTSNKPQGFSPSDQYLFDAENRKFENDMAAAINLQPDTSMYAGVNPGNTVTAQVVFDLPPDAVPSYIVLHDSMFSDGAKVTLQ
ncbi:DUF4352 domain-containing protein [Nocardia iowensis]|uniref:DUF4352 domain-containing protein n=1 Tax=Nocardia iowensis TaxID=204891 RepID=A0ABX8RQ18_NOCIO|nr:DUF4352 domain-containing protein [Nocardia iowensis]QXN91709.1 DUF4352 domain-containing protein [Nocardia iowensis]